MDEKQALKVEVADILMKYGVITQEQREQFNFTSNFNHDKKHFLTVIKAMCAWKELPESTWISVNEKISDSRFDCLFLDKEPPTTGL